MRRTVGVLALLVSCMLGVQNVTGEIQTWAVLVAGSNGWNNYKHQADICHAYQILRTHGVAEENIIVMMYDDIANHPENPNPGVIINKPGGPNVYKNVSVDYTGDDVTPENFLKVLKGDEKSMTGIGSGKVLKSGPNDHVFINFVAYGGLHVLAFSDDGVLYKDQLTLALKTMHKKKMFKKLLFYVEASESGSMFNDFPPPNMNIFAATSSTSSQSSHACCWSDKEEVFLADEFSFSWMEDMDNSKDKDDNILETLRNRFKNVQKRVKGSQLQLFGKWNLGKNHAADFQNFQSDGGAGSAMEPFKDTASSRDVALETLRRKIQLSNTEEGKKKLIKKRDELLKGRKTVDAVFEQIIVGVTKNNTKAIKKMKQTHQPLSMEKMSCYKTLVENFRRACFNINKNTYALTHLFKLANLCTADYSSTFEMLLVIFSLCNDQHRALNNVD